MPAAKKKPLPRLTFEQIEAAEDIKQETVEVPEWGGSVVVRGVPKADYDAFLLLESPDDVHFLLSKAFVEPAIDEEQAAKLRQKSASAMERVEATIMRLCSARGAEQRFLEGADD